MEAVNVNSLTTAGYLAESDATTALDRLLAQHPNHFRVHSEVPGFYVQPKLGGSKPKGAIDRIVIPLQPLVDAGWHHGPFGIECKRSGKKIGKVISQCQDYKRAVFQTSPGFHLMLEWVFIWPLEKQIGDIASVMAQDRIGCARPSWGGGIQFLTDSRILIDANQSGVTAKSTAVGRKVGSR